MKYQQGFLCCFLCLAPLRSHNPLPIHTQIPDMCHSQTLTVVYPTPTPFPSSECSPACHQSNLPKGLFCASAQLTCPHSSHLTTQIAGREGGEAALSELTSVPCLALRKQFSLTAGSQTDGYLQGCIRPWVLTQFFKCLSSGNVHEYSITVAKPVIRMGLFQSMEARVLTANCNGGLEVCVMSVLVFGRVSLIWGGVEG